MRLETFIRKSLRLKAHTVTEVKDDPSGVLVRIDWIQGRRVRCGRCARKVSRVVHRQAELTCPPKTGPCEMGRQTLAARFRDTTAAKTLRMTPAAASPTIPPGGRKRPARSAMNGFSR